MSTQVLVNTESTLMQAANDEEGIVGQRTWVPEGQGLEQASPLHSDQFPGWQVENEIAKPQVS